MKIFWSWQSDTHGKTGRHFVRSALSAAVDRLNQPEEIDEPLRRDPADEVQLDHDRKNVPGSPDLAPTIFKKIPESQVLIADVTPVAVIGKLPTADDRRTEKGVMNPNVAIELGYALKAISSENVLSALTLPADDRNIVVTVHYYDPFPFTHQGAAWTNPSRENLVGVPWGTEADHQTIVRNFSTVAAWSQAHDRPILLGEFGSYDKADMAPRVAWTCTVARTAESNHYAWSYWQFESSFSAYDIANQRWIEPIYNALVPGVSHPQQ